MKTAVSISGFYSLSKLLSVDLKGNKMSFLLCFKSFVHTLLNKNRTTMYNPPVKNRHIQCVQGRNGSRLCKRHKKNSNETSATCTHIRDVICAANTHFYSLQCILVIASHSHRLLHSSGSVCVCVEGRGGKWRVGKTKEKF